MLTFPEALFLAVTVSVREGVQQEMWYIHEIKYCSGLRKDPILYSKTDETGFSLLVK